MPFKGTKCAKI